MIKNLQFDNSQARTFRKRIEVLAFPSEDAFSFHKKWGTQKIRIGGWIIVPLDEEGGVTRDIYGCDATVFQDTYEPSPSLQENRYRKKESIQAYQPGHAFEINTVLADGHVETEKTRTTSSDAWVAKAPGGELYIIEDTEFQRTYVEIQEFK